VAGLIFGPPVRGCQTERKHKAVKKQVLLHRQDKSAQLLQNVAAES